MINSKVLILIFVLYCATASILLPLAKGWSNGGWTTSCESPAYGTHDYLALYALMWVKQYYQGNPADWEWLEQNLDDYLFGTEVPDNEFPPNCLFLTDSDYEEFETTFYHHIYWNYDQTVMCDDAAAEYAQDNYQRAIDALSACEFRKAAFWLGAATHYIADMGVFLHIMDDDACYRSIFNFEEYPCHDDYESWVEYHVRLGGNPFLLTFDGEITSMSAYDAAKNVSRITDRGNWDNPNSQLRGYTRDCMWMLDQCGMVANTPSLEQVSQDFFLSTHDSLNRAANAIADVLVGVKQAAQIACPTLDLVLNQTSYRTGDAVQITARIHNPQALQRVDFYSVLEVYGEFFFYPTWRKGLDCVSRNLYFGNVEIPVLSIGALPPVSPAGPFTVHSVLTEIFTYNLLDYDLEVFDLR